jgi:hypothetical protein
VPEVGVLASVLGSLSHLGAVGTTKFMQAQAGLGFLFVP